MFVINDNYTIQPIGFPIYSSRNRHHPLLFIQTNLKTKKNHFELKYICNLYCTICIHKYFWWVSISFGLFPGKLLFLIRHCSHKNRSFCIVYYVFMYITYEWQKFYPTFYIIMFLFLWTYNKIIYVPI